MLSDKPVHGIPFPKTHSIRELLDLLPQGLFSPAEVQNAAGLTDYAVISRYPGDFEPIDETEYQDAIRLAQAVVSWSEEIIEKRTT